MFFSQWLFQPVVLRREIVVSVWERPQGDDNRLDDLRSLQPGQHPYTFTCPRRAYQPPPSLLLLFLFYNTPNHQQHHHHQPLTLACYSTWIMEEASSVVATNMPRHVLFTPESDRSPLAAAQTREPPARPASLKDISISSVHLLAQSPWPAHPCWGERPHFLMEVRSCR